MIKLIVCLPAWISKKGSYFAPLSPRTDKHQRQLPEVKLKAPPSSLAVTTELSNGASPGINHISKSTTRKPTELRMRGHGKYRRVGVVVPLENGRKNGTSELIRRCG